MSTITNGLFKKVSDAIRLRAIGAGASTFADQTWVYDSGTITAATDNGDGSVTIEDNTKSWMTAPHHRWKDPEVGDPGVTSWDWLSYDLVIEAPSPDYAPDPRKVVQAIIFDQPSATTVKITVNVTNLVTQRVITAVGDWVGRRY